MNKALTILTTLLALLTLTSCGADESTGQTVETPNPLIGNWCYSEDHDIFTVEFCEDGTGSTCVLTYKSVDKEHQWTETHYPFLYTLSGNQLTARLDGNKTLSAIVGITGNSLSITHSDRSVILTRYSSNDIIEALKQDIEDNWLDYEPHDSLTSKDFFTSEANMASAINGLYHHLRDYEYQQLNLENIRLTGKDFRDRQHFITPNSSEIGNTWEKAYYAINSANVIIEALDSAIPNIDENIRLAYKNEALAIRSILYYNVSHLWGRVPYITKRSESTQNANNIPVYTHKDVCEVLIETLKGVGHLPQLDNTQKQYRIDRYAIQALIGEMELSLGHKIAAKAHLNNAGNANFSIAIEQNAEPEMFARFGECLPNYTSAEINLLASEVLADDAIKRNDLLTQWQTLDKQPHWGYWAMLKRTNQALQVSGCAEHELLMPIPEKEVIINPNMTQNPGYTP